MDRPITVCFEDWIQQWIGARRVRRIVEEQIWIFELPESRSPLDSDVKPRGWMYPQPDRGTDVELRLEIEPRRIFRYGSSKRNTRYETGVRSKTVPRLPSGEYHVESAVQHHDLLVGYPKEPSIGGIGGVDECALQIGKRHAEKEDAGRADGNFPPNSTQRSRGRTDPGAPTAT